MLTEIFKRPLNTVQARGIPRDGCQNDLVCLRNVERRFDHSDIAAVDHVDLCVHSGEILAILGPSGSGKSTLLRLIAGFEKPDFGSVLINHSVASNSSKVVPPESRGIGIVFQDYALFPHLSVFDNIAFGTYGSIAVSWLDPDDSNPSTNQHVLGAYGGTPPDFMDATSVTVSSNDYELTDLNFTADLDLANP